ncbi:MAG TPA: SRPBCC family protein [Pyrinomonadaceae bacterium]|nr:SRPBCC family protein [Pyrinomonadaceae bacterium]
MKNLELTKIPVAKAEMLIRKPPAEIFEAFANPEITRRFWFTKSTGRLEADKQLTWTWEMYNHSVQVDVKAIETNKRILIEWGNYGEMTTVEWIFTPHKNDTTYVTITNSGFKGDGDKVVSDALDAKGGFTWVLAGLKALLEHDIELNAIADAFPQGLKHAS